MGWIMVDRDKGEDPFANVKDLQKDKIVMFQHNHYLAFSFDPQTLLFLLPLVMHLMQLLVNVAFGERLFSLDF